MAEYFSLARFLHIRFSLYAKCEAKPSIWVRALGRTAYTVLYPGTQNNNKAPVDIFTAHLAILYIAKAVYWELKHGIKNEILSVLKLSSFLWRLLSLISCPLKPIEQRFFLMK